MVQNVIQPVFVNEEAMKFYFKQHNYYEKT